MQDPEDVDFKRDKRFLIRMGVSLAIVLLLGVLIFAKLTDPSVGGCAARAFDSVTTGE